MTLDRWEDFETLFGPRGACGGCWCMYPRLTASEFGRSKGEGNRKAMRGVVKSGGIPGIIAYEGDVPVGWCAFGPREEYVRLSTSRILKPIDDHPVWSIVCLFVARSHRRQGISTALLRAAADHARKRKAKILEGYPHEVRTAKAPDAFIWTGVASAYREAGFTEVARRSQGRPIMRLLLGGRSRSKS
ncbi:MAG: GNAT family N-acetyltransferase [Candidatus Zixiibacteriota bacterium]